MAKEVQEKTIEIKNADGLHMRPAMQFVDVASMYECDVTVSNEKDSVDGKSIMQMSMLAAICGTKLRVRTEGADAQETLNELLSAFENKFGEGS